MPNKADIFVNFGNGDKALNVKCVIIFDNPVTDFCFSLSTLLTIDNITANNDNTEWKIIRKWQPQWAHESNEIEIASKTPMQKIIIEYHGRISGWCNIIEEKRIALSGYSAWTISDTSEPVKSIFKIENAEDYFIINASYNSSEKLWIYGETDHDAGNIIALKKGYYVANTGDFNFYYLNKAEKPYADNYTYYYDEIIKYYSSVFSQKNIDKIDIVSLDIEKGGGAYFRKELIVIDKINISENKNEVRESTISLLGHELGHNWFTGANTSSWEDWLNETGAEWAALLYILSLNEKDFFDKRILQLNEMEHYSKTPVIKPPDLKRPIWGVHTRGVMMFYEIYCKCGMETILKILQILTDLRETGKEVTTDCFLSELRAKVDNAIPEAIERGLTMNDYSGLFHE